MSDRDHFTDLLKQRFWSKVQKTDGCWEWTAAKVHFGHGQFWFRWRGERGTMVEAHRVAWLFCIGDVPTGQCVLHKCDNPGCVRPSHLYVGNKRDNAIDRKVRSRHWKDRDPDAFFAHQLKIASNGRKDWEYVKDA